MHGEFEASYLTRFREEVDLPAAELRHRLIRDLVDTAPDRSEAPRAGAQLRLRLGLRRLGERMIAAGEWLARANEGDSDLPRWTGQV